MARQRSSSTEQRQGHLLGQVLRRARLSKGLSAQDLAEKAGMSIDTVRSIENGRTLSPSFFTVLRFADALNIRLDFIHSELQESDNGKP